MRRGLRRHFLLAVAAVLFCLAASGIGWVQEVQAVLCSELDPYREAFEVVLNMKAANNAGLRIAPVPLKKIEKVLP
jgi:hypothetical protein